MKDCPTLRLLPDSLLLPAARPDETLYSWCARFHRLSISHDARATSKRLFGHPTAGLRHDFPHHIGHFSNATHDEIGSVTELLHRRTLFGFYARFLPTDITEKVSKNLLAGENLLARASLGLARTGLNLVNPLKYCPACINQQWADHSFTWWQMSHQLPSSYICHAHGEWLEIANVTQYRGVMNDFYLPSRENPVVQADSLRLTLKQRQHAARISDWGRILWQRGGVQLSEETLRDCYLMGAKSRDWLTLSGTVRLQQLRDAFLAHYKDAFELFDDGFLGDLDGVNGGFLAYMFRRLPGTRHPVKHILLINFLFESPEHFFSVLDQVTKARQEGGAEAVKKQLCETGEYLCRLVSESGLSVNKAAETVGITATSASRHLDRQGVQERERRPHIVGTEKERQLSGLLSKGASRRDIAQSLGLRKSFIKDYLATRPELKKSWSEKYQQNLRDQHRRQLMNTLRGHPGLPIKSIRRIPNNGFQWLYNHDRDWLQEVLPAIWKR